MKSPVRVLLAWLVTACAVGADAEVVRWLYDVEVPVASQAERQRAARAGLRELLGRVTGLAELPRNPDIAAALREPEKYYGRFEFSTHTVPPVEPNLAPTEQSVLEVSFEPAAILALLRRADLPVWSADRPTVLVWLVVEQDDSRRLVAAALADDITAAVGRRARQRGLQLSLPVMDLVDRALSPVIVWGKFWELIAAASMRYGMDVLVLGRIVRRVDGSWAADWELRSPDSQDIGVEARFRNLAESAPGAATAGVDLVADALAARFAVGGELGAIAVTVHGASTVAAYASVLDYLESREYVERLEVKVVARDALTVHLHSRSDRDQLQELLSMGTLFTVLPDAPETGPGRSIELTWGGDL